MREQKNIDRLFQETFKDFEATPDDQVWANIEKELKKNKERKPFIIPLWYKIAGVVALLALLFWVGQPLWQASSTEDINVVNTNQDIKKADNTPEDSQMISETNLKEDTHNSVTAETKETNNVEGEKSTTLKADGRQTIKRQQPQKDVTIAGVRTTDEKDYQKRNDIYNNTAVVTTQTPSSSIEDARKSDSEEIAETIEKTTSSSKTTNTKSLLDEANKVSEDLYEETLLTESPENTKKWEVQPHAAPIYYNGLGDGSTIDPNFSDNKTTTDVSLAYGVNFSYAISERLKVRTGIGRVSHNLNTNGVSFGATATPVALRNISQDALNGLFVEIVDTQMAERQQQVRGNDLLNSDASQFFEGSINQTLGYIEVPVELEYAFLDTKFGVSLIGGASTLFLDENIIAVETRGNVNEIGEANNVNNVSFSTNIGLGINYKLSKSLRINLEPTFKYQINTFSDSNNFNPYYLGLYSGFSFKF